MSDKEAADVYNKLRTVALDKKNTLRPTHWPLAEQLVTAEQTPEALMDILKKEDPRLANIDAIKGTDRVSAAVLSRREERGVGEPSRESRLPLLSPLPLLRPPLIVSQLHLPPFFQSQSRNWLRDESQREMLLVRAAKATLVLWWDPATGEPVLQCDGEEARKEKKSSALGSEPVWTNYEAFWSPQGTYLCTIHPQGVRLWTGDNFVPVARIQHRNVKEVLFSPDEKYVVTSNGQPGQPITVRSVASGELLLSIPQPVQSPTGDSNWPLVVWSHNSQYLAASSEAGVTLWEVPSMEEVKIPEAITGNRPYLQFAWQPNSRLEDAPVLSLWIAAQNPDSPCRLTLISVPSMQILTSKNLFAVDNAGRIMWQKKGDHCGLLTRISRRILGKPKIVKTQMEIFRMRVKNLPVDSVEFNDEVINVFWSDMGNRFAVLIVNANKVRKMVFYTINHRGIEVAAELDVPREMNSVVWSPLGTHFVVGSVGSTDSSGLLWFCQCNENEEGRTYSIEISYKDEMNKLQGVQWDPSGRFVLTSKYSLT